jgi:uncharacterized protein YceK
LVQYFYRLYCTGFWPVKVLIAVQNIAGKPCHSAPHHIFTWTLMLSFRACSRVDWHSPLAVCIVDIASSPCGVVISHTKPSRECKSRVGMVTSMRGPRLKHLACVPAHDLPTGSLQWGQHHHACARFLITLEAPGECVIRCGGYSVVHSICINILVTRTKGYHGLILSRVAESLPPFHPRGCFLSDWAEIHREAIPAGSTLALRP